VGQRGRDEITAALLFLTEEGDAGPGAAGQSCPPPGRLNAGAMGPGYGPTPRLGQQTGAEPVLHL